MLINLLSSSPTRQQQRNNYHNAKNNLVSDRVNGEFKKYLKRASHGRYVRCMVFRWREFCSDSVGVYVQDFVLPEMRLFGKEIVAGLAKFLPPILK